MVYYLDGEPQIPSLLTTTYEIKDEEVHPKEDKFYTIASRRLLEMAGYTLLPFNFLTAYLYLV